MKTAALAAALAVMTAGCGGLEEGNPSSSSEAALYNVTPDSVVCLDPTTEREYGVQTVSGEPLGMEHECRWCADGKTIVRLFARPVDKEWVLFLAYTEDGENCPQQ